MRSKKEVYDHLIELLALVSTTNDYTVDHAKQLRLILLNLKVVGANENVPAIKPLAQDLERAVGSIGETVGETIRRRPELNKVLIELKNLLNIDEKGERKE